MITEKSEAIAAATSSADSKTVVVVASHQQQVHHGRQSVNRPPTSALIGHHHHHHHHHQPPPPPSHHQPVHPPHNQQPPLHHNRSGSSLSVTDYREPVTTPTVIALESAGGGGRRAAVNGSISNVICGPTHPTHAAVWHPRPIYPFPLPLTNATALWHQPHFPTPSVTFPPFIEVSRSHQYYNLTYSESLISGFGTENNVYVFCLSIMVFLLLLLVQHQLLGYITFNKINNSYI